MLRKALYIVGRGGVFLLATVTASVLVTTALGVVVTILKWLTGSEPGGVFLMVLMCVMVAGLIWGWRRRSAKPANVGRSPRSFPWLTAMLLILAVALGWGMSRFKLTPLLTLGCLHPLGGLAAPMLVTALEDGEASSDACRMLQQYPDVALRQLPRLEKIIRENRSGAVGHAIEIIASLGPKAKSAVPVLIERMRFEIADRDAIDDSDFPHGYLNWWFRDPQDSDDDASFPSDKDDPSFHLWRPETSPASFALVKVGPLAIPAITDALTDSKDFRERLVLASVLRYSGNASSPAVPALIAILNDSSDGPMKNECIVRVLVTLAAIRPDTGEAAPIIISWAVDPAQRFSRAAIYALGGIGHESNGAVPALLQVLEEPVPNPFHFSDFDIECELPRFDFQFSRRGIAIESLVHIGPAAVSALPKLVELANIESDIEYACIRAMAKMGPPGLQEVARRLSGPNDACAAAAIEKVGPAAKEVLPALWQAFQSAAPEDRFFYAMAIDRVEGPTDELLVAMAEHLVSREEHRKTAFRSVNADIYARLEDLGPQAKAVVPLLTKLVSTPGNLDRLRIARVLWKIDPVPSAVLPAVLEDLTEGLDRGRGLGLDRDWFVEVDPTGEQVIPALTQIVATSDNNEEAIIALSLFGDRARPALPAVLAHGQSYVADEFLWRLSAWDFFRYSVTGKVIAFILFCVLCLIVECVYFRWSLRLRKEISDE